MLSSYKIPREAETTEIDLDVQKAEFWKEGYQKGVEATYKKHYALLLKAFLALNNQSVHKEICEDIASSLNFVKDNQ